jgi:hypothetical protein
MRKTTVNPGGIGKVYGLVSRFLDLRAKFCISLSEDKREALRIADRARRHGYLVTLVACILLYTGRSAGAPSPLSGHLRTLEVPRIKSSAELVISPPSVEASEHWARLLVLPGG